jgi:branched-subunit amino acid transport protein
MQVHLINVITLEIKFYVITLQQIPADPARHHTVDRKTLRLSSNCVWCILHTSSAVIFFPGGTFLDKMSFPQFWNDIFCHSVTWYFAFSISELLEKHLHQDDPEWRLINLLSGVMSINYHCIQHCGFQNVFFPECLSNLCLHHTFSKICTQFDAVPFVGSIAKLHQARYMILNKRK